MRKIIPFFLPFPPLKCFLSDRWKLHFPISRVLCHLSFFFFFSFFSRTSVKNAKSYELKSEIEKFRRVFRCIYIVYKVQRRMRESMVFDFQTNETRESMYFVYQRWRGETCESTSLVFIPSRDVYFSILSGDAEAYGCSTSTFLEGM